MELKSHLMQMFLPLMFVCHATKMKADSPLELVRDSYFGEDANRDGQLSEDEDLNQDGILNWVPNSMG